MRGAVIWPDDDAARTADPGCEVTCRTSGRPLRPTRRLRACSLWPDHDPGGWGSGHRAAALGAMSATAGSALGRPWLAPAEVAVRVSVHSVAGSAPVPHQGTVAARARPVKVFRSRLSAGFLEPLAVALDRGLIRQLVGGMDIPADQLHVGLQEVGQLARVIGLDQHEACPTAGQVVPAADLVGVVLAGVVLLDNLATNLLGGGVRVPPEAAVPQHASPLDSSARRCLPGWLTDIPLRQTDEQGQPQGGCPLSSSIYRHEPVTAKGKLGADSGGSASTQLAELSAGKLEYRPTPGLLSRIPESGRAMTASVDYLQRQV